MTQRPLVIAGIFLGLGLGGFFDGIVLHQILQWHHLVTSAGYPPTSVENLEINTFWDGMFHALTYILTAIGLFLLWRALQRRDVPRSGSVLIGAMLAGWGLFNLIEGLLSHQILGIHHVRSGPDEAFWDIAFLVWGALMLIGGGWLIRTRQGQTTLSANER